MSLQYKILKINFDRHAQVISINKIIPCAVKLKRNKQLVLLCNKCFKGQINRFGIQSNIFAGARLENCSLLGTDNVRGQTFEHMLAPNCGCCLFMLDVAGFVYRLSGG